MKALGPADLFGWICARAAAEPDKPALVSVEDGRSVTYGALRTLIGRIQAHHAARGIGRGDRVVLLANNSLEHLLLYLGTLAAGVTICTIHVEMNAGHLRDLLPALRPRLVVYDSGLGLDDVIGATPAPAIALDALFNAFPAAPSDVGPVAGPTDDGVIFFTSGTTARPKGVVLSYRELLNNGAAAADGFGFAGTDRLYDTRSYSWASAQLLLLGALSKGATLLMRRRFSRSQFFADIERHGATIAAGNPTIINMLLQGGGETAPVPCLRFMTSSSAPLMEDEWRRFEARFGVTIVQGFGTSETGWIAASAVGQRRFGSAGRPLPYQRLAIVDANGRAVAAGERGLVEVGAFADNPYRQFDETGQIVTNAVGRMQTGDMGYLDRDGYLHLTGRVRELIIRGGVNISPVEIDHVLASLPGVAEAATVGVPDPIYGEEVVSYVVPASGATITPADLLATCAARLPAAKAPKDVVFCGSLPKTERGKLDRKVLAELWRRTNGG